MKERCTFTEPRADMPGILILSHGDFALGMLDSAEMICGPLDNIAVLTVEPGDDLEAYRARLLELLDVFPAGAYVLVDILGGTPFNSLAEVVGERKLYGMAGANLPLLLETAMKRGSADLEEISTSAMETAQASLVDLAQFC